MDIMFGLLVIGLAVVGGIFIVGIILGKIRGYE
jgi:hypothetical protein